MKKQVICIAMAGMMILSQMAPAFAETTGRVVETTPAAISPTEEVIPLQPTKSLSLAQAIKIMTTTGTRAQTAELNRKSDIAVENGYMEAVQRINKAWDKVETAEKVYSYYSSVGKGKDFLDSIGVRSIVELSYNAQAAGATSTNKNISRLRRDFAKANKDNNYQADINQIEQDTINIYNTVLLAEENHKITKDNLVAQQKNLKNVNAKKEVGLLSKKDVLEAQSAVMEAESAVRAAETQMEYAHMSFNYLLGYNVMQSVKFTDKLVEEQAEIADVDTAIKKALENRNEIKGADLAKEIYKLLLEDLKAYPHTSSTYLTAQNNLLTAEKTAKDAKSQIEIDIRNKAAILADKKAALDAAKALKQYAIEGERLVALTNEEGLSTVQDLLATQVKLYKANLNMAKATSEYNLAMKSYNDAQGIGTMRIPL